MTYPRVPTYLACIAQNYYTNRFTGDCAVLPPQLVHHMFLQEQFDIQQRNAQAHALSAVQFDARFQPQVPPVQAHIPPVQAHIPLLQAQIPPVQTQIPPFQPQVPPVQAQAPPVIANNYGPVNVGSGNFNSYQSGVGNHLYNLRQGHNQVNGGIQTGFGTALPPPTPDPAPEVINYGQNPILGGTQAGFGVALPIPTQAPAQGVISHDHNHFDGSVQVGFNTPFPPHTPAHALGVIHHGQNQVAGGVQARFSAPIPNSAPVATQGAIDLTEDHSVQAPVVTLLKVVPLPRAKAKSSFWKKGEKYLRTKLNNQSGSYTWRLFESMYALGPSEQKYRYCEAHWSTEKDAYEDVVKMSRYFIDVNEMLMYALKWDRLDKLPAFEEASDEVRKEREKLEKEIADEQSSLMKALPEKRNIRREEEEQAQFSGLVGNMKRSTFEANFDMKKNMKNVREAVSRRQQQLAEEKASYAAQLEKRKAKSMPAGCEKPSKKPKPQGNQFAAPAVTPTHITAQEVGSDIDAEGETDSESTASIEERFEQAMLEALGYDESPVETQAPTPHQLQELSEIFSFNLEDIEYLHEHTVEDLPGVEPDRMTPPAADESPVETRAPTPDQLQEPFDDLFFDSEDMEYFQEHAAEDIPAVEPDQMAPPTVDELLVDTRAPTPDQLQEPFDDLFFDSEDIEYSQEHADEDPPAAVPEQAATPAADQAQSQETEDLVVPEAQEATRESSPAEELPTLMTEEEAAALTAKKNKLVAEHTRLTTLLAENRAEVAKMEDVIQSVIATGLRNKLFKKRMESSLKRDQPKLEALNREGEQYEERIVELDWEIALLPDVPVVVSEDKPAKKAEPKRVAVSCGSSKLRW